MPKIELNLSFALGFFLLIALYITLIFLEDVQERMIYQQAYVKNQECRIASQKSGFTNSIEKICGAVPKFEDY